jgi:hypothetical protein
MPDPDPEGKKDMDALAIDAARSEEGRGLATARAVLKVLAHLERHPKGVRAAEVAEVVNKSTSTAYYLLANPTAACTESHPATAASPTSPKRPEAMS